MTDILTILQIFDGSNVSAPGSLWTYNSRVPVYSSSGTHIFMVFKTGWLLGKNRNLGFVAEVSFVSAESSWDNRPHTQFCSPLVHLANNYASLIEIVYNTTTPSLPVYCSYTAHILYQEVMYIATNAELTGTQMKLSDYPSATVGTKLSPQNISIMTSRFNETMTLYQYNLSSAVYGFHLELKLNFTHNMQRLIAVSSNSTLFAGHITQFMSKYTQFPLSFDYSSRDCPYNGSPIECKEYMDKRGLDHTCVSYAGGDNDTYALCASNNHCYNTQIDQCDSFVDCEDCTDEVGCPQENISPASCKSRHTDENTSPSSKAWVAAPVVIIGLAVIAFIVWAAVRKHQKLPIFPVPCRSPPSPSGSELLPLET